jgi:hypothetical protein
MCLRYLRKLARTSAFAGCKRQERLQDAEDWQHSQPSRNNSLLLLEIDDYDCKYQDRTPANQKLFDVSIEHGTPPLE